MKKSKVTEALELLNQNMKDVEDHPMAYFGYDPFEVRANRGDDAFTLWVGEEELKIPFENLSHIVAFFSMIKRFKYGHP